jgi:hypothetical protein
LEDQMFDGTMFSAERAAVAIGMLAVWAGERRQALRQWFSYRPERRYMRGPSVA